MANDKSIVRSVERALQLLKCFSFEHKEMSLATLSKISGLPKTTVFRLLTCLEEQGFVEKDTLTQNYKLGLVLFQLGNIVASNMELRKVSIPIMEELAEKTGETININIVRDNKRVCIEKKDGSHDLRQFIEIGKSVPLYRGASGKLLLAFLPEEQKFEILESAKDDLRKSIEQMVAELDEIKRKGYAVSRDERVLGAAAVSTPIFDYTGKLVAGLTISGAAVRFTKERIDEFIKLAIDGALRISQALGYKGVSK